MAFKVVLALALVAVASAIPVEYHEDHHAPAEYVFEYAVHDEHTGDIKSHKESRKGDQVQGQYELIDSDGYKRIVEYTADKHSGFNAVVHREPTNIKIPVPVHKEVHHVVPVAKVVAPVVHLSHHVTPVQKVIAPVHHQYEPAHVTFTAPEFNYHY